MESMDDMPPGPLSLLEQWLPSSSETEEEEEVVDGPHKYDPNKYKRVLDLIKKEVNDLAGTAMDLDKAFYDTVPLNLMNDSVLHEVIARRKTCLAVAIIDTLKPNKGSMLRHRNYYGDTPLHIAAMKGDGTVAEALVRKRQSLARERNRKGETPLHKAALFGHLDLFNIIIIVVGSRDIAFDRTGDGSTILHYAIMRGHTKIALAIVERFPDLISTRNAYGPPRCK